MDYQVLYKYSYFIFFSYLINILVDQTFGLIVIDPPWINKSLKRKRNMFVYLDLKKN